MAKTEKPSKPTPKPAPSKPRPSETTQPVKREDFGETRGVGKPPKKG